MAMSKKKAIELDKLLANVNRKARLPRGFAFWSLGMQMAWLRQNQKKPSARLVT